MKAARHDHILPGPGCNYWASMMSWEAGELATRGVPFRHAPAFPHSLLRPRASAAWLVIIYLVRVPTGINVCPSVTELNIAKAMHEAGSISR